MAFFFLKKTAQKVRRTFTKIAAVNIINSVKRAIFSKGNGFLLVKNMSFRGIIKGYLSKGNGFLLNKTTKNMQGNREMSFKRKRLPLEQNSKIRCRIRGFFQRETVSS